MSGFIKQFLFRQFRKHETRVHELTYLFWECTTRCNLKCLHCGSECSSDSSHQDMPVADFLKALDTIPKKRDPITVVFTGGEPLLRNDLEQCGLEIRKKKMRWGIVTNGYLYSAERHYSLLSAGMGSLTISLDGLEDTHNWLRYTKKKYSLVTEAIRLAAKSNRLNFDVVTCVNQRNISQLAEVEQLLLSLGVKSWRLFTIAPIGRARQNDELLLSDKQMKQLMDYIVSARQRKKTDIKFSCEGYTGAYENKVREGYFFCRAGINIASILIDGSISACPNIDRSFIQGNIYKDNFYEVWQNKFLPFRIRTWTQAGACKDCNEYKDCVGNGMHLWHGEKNQVLVCHHQKIRAGSQNDNHQSGSES